MRYIKRVLTRFSCDSASYGNKEARDPLKELYTVQ